MSPDARPDILEHMFLRMCTVRELEEEIGRQHQRGNTRGPIHRCDGQEAVGVGVTAALRATDVATSTHRGHAHYIGKGADLRRLVAEIFGRATGYCRGRAGHMLVADASIGLLGGNGIVGGAIPVATGQAFAFQVQKTDRIVACFFGEGAAQIGAFHEALNVAALWKLPVVYICENNQYGLTVHARHQSSVDSIASRGVAYDMPAIAVDGNDVVAVYEATRDATARARRGGGPALIEAQTYRMTGFSTSDLGGYQPGDEMAGWAVQDPIRRLRERLLAKHGDAGRVEALETQARAAVEDAVAFALGSPWPTAGDFAPDVYAVEAGG
jgi:pyruvate dehydrogenase E1 component alpha subunit